MNRPAVRRTRRRVRVPELRLQQQTLHTPHNESAPLPGPHARARTPGDSKQHRFVCLVVLWHDAAPDVLQPELSCALRAKRSAASSAGETRAEARAGAARAPSARAAASSIIVGGSGEGRRQRPPAHTRALYILTPEHAGHRDAKPPVGTEAQADPCAGHARCASARAGRVHVRALGLSPAARATRGPALVHRAR